MSHRVLSCLDLLRERITLLAPITRQLYEKLAGEESDTDLEALNLVGKQVRLEALYLDGGEGAEQLEANSKALLRLLRARPKALETEAEPAEPLLEVLATLKGVVARTLATTHEEEQQQKAARGALTKRGEALRRETERRQALLLERQASWDAALAQRRLAVAALDRQLALLACDTTGLVLARETLRQEDVSGQCLRAFSKVEPPVPTHDEGPRSALRTSLLKQVKASLESYKQKEKHALERLAEATAEAETLRSQLREQALAGRKARVEARALAEAARLRDARPALRALWEAPLDRAAQDLQSYWRAVQERIAYVKTRKDAKPKKKTKPKK